MFFDKKTRSRANLNQFLSQELHKPVIKKIERRKVNVRLNNNIWLDLAEMGSVSSFNRSVKYLLSVIVVSTKYTSVKALKDKKTKILL